MSIAPLPLLAGTLGMETDLPIVVLEKVSMDPAVAGGEFTLGLSVRNLTDNQGVNFAFSFSLKGENTLEPFSLAPNQTTTFDRIEARETKTVYFTFLVDKEAQNKDYELMVSLNGKSPAQTNVSSGTMITVPVTYDQTKPVIVIRSAEVNPVQPDAGDEFSVNLTLENLSKTTDARNIVLLLGGGDNFEVKDVSNKKNVVKLDKGTQTVVSYRLQAKDTRADNTVKLNLSFDYLASDSSSIDETINLPLDWSGGGAGTTPWVIVNKYTLSDERVLAGNTVTLRLYIENTNLRPVKNVKISLGVIKIEETSGSTTTSTSGGTVFSPVNSSNSFYIDSIPGKSAIEKEVDLYVDPNASAKTYIVPVSIKYEDRGGKVLESEELVNIPVTQECKLNVISMTVPTDGFVGQPIMVMSEFVNVGKVMLGNFMVRMDGEFQKENSTYYVGNMEIGYSDFYQAELIPDKPGTLEGKVVFSYIDNNNKDVEVEEPFTINIMEQMAPMGGEVGKMGEFPDGKMPGGMGNSGGRFMASLKSNWLPVLLGLIMLGEGFFIWRMKRNNRNKEFLDE
jgi:hypothetical protein